MREVWSRFSNLASLGNEGSLESQAATVRSAPVILRSKSSLEAATPPVTAASRCPCPGCAPSQFMDEWSTSLVRADFHNNPRLSVLPKTSSYVDLCILIASSTVRLQQDGKLDNDEQSVSEKLPVPAAGGARVTTTSSVVRTRPSLTRTTGLMILNTLNTDNVDSTFKTATFSHLGLEELGVWT
ncbi:hypothetical protein O3P69_018682 [Scylla paramamosain]|uniref:Uncharacterized protein n=1 Tax=Scylla paramamosain TaxID=85552 RepID=A0AAW0SD25_SCYPA